MRYSQAEKMEIIRLVEGSDLPVKRTLAELDVPRSTFYDWYRRYQEAGYDGLTNGSSQPSRFWNRIPEGVREHVREPALQYPDKSSRQLAWYITDTEGYFLSESSVYRILKSFDLVTSPVFQLVSAAEQFKDPTCRVNELWQTDFTQFKVVGWGWYYLCTVLDDYSRYILAWRLSQSMATVDVQETLEMALDKTDVSQIKVEHRPRLLSDNGPSFVSQALEKYLKRYRIKHVRSAPYHPMTQGKIERYHRSMKNIVKLETFYFPWELEQAISSFVDYYNEERYHEALDNMPPETVYLGRAAELKRRREESKLRTLRERRQHNLEMADHSTDIGGERLSYFHG